MSSTNPPTNVAGKKVEVAAQSPAQTPSPPAPVQQQIPKLVPYLAGTPPPPPPPPIINGKPVILAIAVPATPWVDWRWSFWFSQLRMQFPSAIVMADNKYGIAQSREALLNQFNAIPALTHMLFVDTDLIAPDFAIYSLLQHNVDIVSGVYWNSLFTGNAAWIDEQPININNFNAQNMNVSNPLLKVDKCGFGFTLISKELMKKLLTEDRPLFYYKITGGELHSEDFYFASILKRLGVPMYVDLRIRLQHVKTVLINANGQVQLG